MHPVLFTIGDRFFLGTYGLMVAVGLLAAIQLAAWRAKRRGVSPDAVYDLALFAVITGFVSARVLYIFLNFDEFQASPRDLIFSRTGFVFLGGFVGAALASVAFLQWKRIPVLAMADIMVPSLALGHAFGRIGCHFAGCCWGGPCSVEPLGIRVGLHLQPDGSPFYNALVDQIERGKALPDALLSNPVWPVQLMEAGALLLLTAGLLLFDARNRRPGRTLALYVMCYAVIRFGLEFLRGDLERGVFGALSTSQIISLALVPVGAWLWFKTSKQAPAASAAPPPPAGQ